MLLVLMRHARAARGGPWADADRPLLPAGEAQAERTGHTLVRMGVRIPAVLTSPAQRCRHTAERVAAALSLSRSHIHTDDGLAVGAGAARILEALAVHRDRYAGATTHLVVGHQPDLEALARHLVASEMPGLSLPPGGCMALETRDGTLTSPATLLWVLPPAALADGLE